MRDEAKRIVEVEWEDSNSSHGWQTFDDIAQQPFLITSVGYVLRDEESGLLITESLDHQVPQPGRTHKAYGCALTIPRSAIREVRELKYHATRQARK